MDENLLRLAWLPQSKVLDDIVLRVKNLADAGLQNGLVSVQCADQSALVKALLHNLLVLLEAQKIGFDGPAKSAVNSQLNTFVVELGEVNRDIIERIVRCRNNPDADSSDLHDCAGIQHLLVINAEQIIRMQSDCLACVQDTNNPHTLRVLSVESTAILNAMLCTIRGLYGYVTVSSASILEKNTHERMQQLRTVAAPPSSAAYTTPSSSEQLQLTSLPLEFNIPAAYKKAFVSPAVAVTTPNSAAPFLIIVEPVLAQLTQIVDLLALQRASSAENSRKIRVQAQSGPSMVDAAVREDRAHLLTQTIIHVARHWNKMTPSEESDSVAAHTIIHLLASPEHLDGTSGRGSNAHSSPCALQSAGFTAVVPIAMRLLDRYQCSSHTLGLLLLYKAADATPSGLLATFLDWILPHIFTYLEIVSDDWSRLVVSRLLHCLIASSVSSPLALQHSHLYVESSIRQLQMKPTVEFAWPYLLHFHAMLSWYPEGTLRCHLTALVDAHLQLLNVWHLPLQSAVLQGIFALTRRVHHGMEPYVHKIATELCRLAIFYHSQQRDISGASPECVAIILANCITLGALLRSLSVTSWDAYLSEVLVQMKQSLSGEEGGGRPDSSKKKSREAATAHALLVVADFQQSVQGLLV